MFFADLLGKAATKNGTLNAAALTVQVDPVSSDAISWRLTVSAETEPNKGRTARLSTNDIAEALILAKGIFAVAARHLGCHRNTITNRLKRNQKLRDLVKQIDADVGDLAEQRLFRLINDGHFGAIKFYLSTKQKHRGYVVRQQISPVTDPDNPNTGVIVIPAMAVDHDEYFDELRQQQQSLAEFGRERAQNQA